MKITKISRKTRVLTKARFGCLAEVYSVNITRGCEFQCAYCYARGYPGAPETGEVQVYINLPERLKIELDNPRRRVNIGKVAFNTASDSFQTHPEILDISYKSMKILLERKISISFLTKGWIPDQFMEMFSRYGSLVSANIGLVSISDRYWQIFEPGAARPGQRLDNIRRLKSVGIEPSVRIDPIIPFYADSEGSVRNLFEALAKVGVKKVTLSYLHLRPAILKQLGQELPGTEFKVLEACFKTQPWSCVGTSTKSKLIPFLLRKKGYERFIAAGKEYGITCLICSCKNPDMPAHRCFSGDSILPKATTGPDQLSLFQCLHSYSKRLPLGHSWQAELRNQKAGRNHALEKPKMPAFGCHLFSPMPQCFSGPVTDGDHFPAPRLLEMVFI